MSRSKAGVTVAFIATPAVGNLVPAVEFAQRLIDRDPRISATILIITIPQRPIVTEYAASRPASAPPGLRFVHLPPVDPPPPDHFQSSIGFISILIERHKPHVKRALADVVSSDSDSVSLACLFLDMFSTTMIDVALELGVPSYLYFASPAGFLGLMLHLPTIDSLISGELDDSDSELIIPSFANPVPATVLPSAVLRRKRDGYSWLLYHARRYRETRGIIVNTFQELEPFALNSLSADQVAPVYPVGPVLDLLGPAQWHFDPPQNEAIVKWLDDQPPASVVFLCFGSMGSLGAAQSREIALGLERTGCRFLWSLRQPAEAQLSLPTDYADLEGVLPRGFLDRTAGLGLICGWVSQVTVLAHRAVGGFVSHCGWNSILESLWFDVPIATWPIYAEQQMNAFEMVRELGLSMEIRLDYRHGGELVRAEEVERGVKQLMEGDGEVRRRVQVMGEKGRTAVMEGGSSYQAVGRLIEELVGGI
ncbi:UDP-glycosyltransferase 43-like [Malania oleifera]|uniref:UDP-glycosyltransferase 43-like n=1 Tax=Malania oleifera TaxID=397392 RepID=UPI0025ADFC59|nr:UDP-glycosyltransferase 43-like [Malania oleifera]